MKVTHMSISMMKSSVLVMALSLSALCSGRAGAEEPQSYRVGLAKIDITPETPIRLNGFAFRRAESTGVAQRTWARALAIDDGGEPALLITVDVLGIPASIRSEIARRLENRAGLKPARLAITATHTHSAPLLAGANPTIFGVPIPKEHQANIERYTASLVDKLEKVGLEALKNRQPAKLSYGIGTVGFAKNRRPQSGPVDHDLPMLVIRDPKGSVRAVYVSYACHCVALSGNKISGDWAGYAVQAIEDHCKGAQALVSIGCGADADPFPRSKGDDPALAQRQGEEVAREVARMLEGYLAPVTGKIETTVRTIELPLADLPSKEVWEEKAKRKDAIGYHARVQLERLARGEALLTKIDYPIQSWMFGDSLAMLFLPGEVVADYSLKLKRTLDGRRVWINAYANAAPCYIPSERVLKEGGYEGGAAMIYYDVPVPFKPGLEKSIVDSVLAQLGQRFSSPYDANKTQGTVAHSPQQSQSAWRTKPGLEVELVVAEPMVVSPVAIDFGPDGRLWVVEMIDYPAGINGNYEPAGRVRVLEDTTGQGRFDKSTVFIDKIPFPTDIKVWRKGVLICAAPDIIYAEDSKRDGKADIVRKLYSGYYTNNFQARVNGLQYSLDNWIYGSCGLFGGKIKSFAFDQPFDLTHRDFRTHPDTGEIEPASGQTQQGRVRDDWENWYGCDNTNLLWHYPLADNYLKRNSRVAAPNNTIYVPDYPESNHLFPIKKDLQLFPLSGPAGFTTAACGIAIYRDQQLGADFRGDAFICEPVNVLVHRLKLKPNGSTFSGRRAADEQTSEFLASTDNWSRPVEVKTGPDGALWVVDMYRFVIEHPRWIPPPILAGLDVRAGANMGRIYRIKAKDQPLRPWTRLDKLGTAELVKALDTDNGWQRDTVSQMLLWNADPAAIEPLRALRKSNRAEARVHALCVLDGFKALVAEDVGEALLDPHSGVRRQAVRLAEKFMNGDSDIGPKVAGLIADTDAQVRLQVAYSLGFWSDPRAGKALGTLVRNHAADPYLIAAALSSVTDHNLAEVLDTALDAQATPELTKQLTALVCTMDGGRQIDVVLKKATAATDGHYAPWQLACVAEYLELKGKGDTHEQKFEAVFADARKNATSAEAPLQERIAAVTLLGRESANQADDIAKLVALLTPSQPADLQTAALTALSRMNDDRVAGLLLDGWKAQSPSVKADILEMMLGQEVWARALLERMEKGTLPANQIDAARRQRLLTHKAAEIRNRAEKLFAGEGSGDRQKLVRDYESVTATAGDKTRGKAVFAKTCSICHQLEGVGHQVGPDLAQVANKSPLYLLTEILDPNRNVDSRFIEYQAALKNGRTVTGLLATETSNNITLRGQEGKEQTILRSEIELLTSTGRSLMPEGLEKDLPKPVLADLLAYLTALRLSPKKFPGNQPETIRAENGQFILPATSCQIFGKEIDFEPDLKNVGMWRGEQDHIIWTLTNDAPAELDVYLDYSCSDASAGNRFVLEGAEPVLRGTVEGTGAWNKYRQIRIGTINLSAGPHTLIFRPDGALVREALLDLRCVYLVPKGKGLKN